MPDTPASDERAAHLRRALQRWDNEGGARPGSPATATATATADPGTAAVPPLGNAELVQMQTRVIALENVVIAMLVQATDAQLDLIRAMADYISPRPGFTPHPLTIGAAGEMISLIERSAHFRSGDIR